MLRRKEALRRILSVSLRIRAGTSRLGGHLEESGVGKRGRDRGSAKEQNLHWRRRRKSLRPKRIRRWGQEVPVGTKLGVRLRRAEVAAEGENEEAKMVTLEGHKECRLVGISLKAPGA